MYKIKYTVCILKKGFKMNTQHTEDTRILVYITHNKIKTIASTVMVLGFIYMITTDVLEIPNELLKYINNTSYLSTFTLGIFILLVSLPLSSTYKEKVEKIGT